MAPGSSLRARSDRGRHRPARLAASRCRRRSPRSTLAAAPGLPAAAAAPAMGEEDYYLELCDRPVHFEKANPVNCVFFDEANKQVRAGPCPPPRRGLDAPRPASPAPRGRPARTQAGCRGGGQAWGLPSGPGAGVAPAPGSWVGRGTGRYLGGGFLLQSDSWVDPEPAPPTQHALWPVGSAVSSPALSRCLCCLYMSPVTLAVEDLDVEITLTLGILERGGKQCEE